MVLKGTKRAFRTGNTLRNTANVQTNKRTRSVIVRHSANLSRRQQSDEADDSFLTADAVEFSLNKKGRWNLPGVIEANIIHDDDCCDDGLIRVSMLHRHRMNRQSDCLNVITRSAVDDAERCEVYSAPQRKKARRKTYCNGLNVLHNGRGKSTKDSKKKQVISTKQDLAQRERRTASDASQQNAAPDPKPATPQVQYDVFYSLPTSSSLRFHPKFAAEAAPRDGIEQNLIATAGLKPSKGSNHRHKHIDYDDVYDEDDFYDWGYGEEYEDLHEYSYTEQDSLDQYGGSHSTDVCRESAVLFSEVMEHAFATEVSSSAASGDLGLSSYRKTRRAKAGKRKGGRYLYRPETVDDFDSCLEDSRSEVSTESEMIASSTASSASSQQITFIPTQLTSVNVKLSKEATSRQVLVGLYGSRFTEAACLPRKIIIDITDRVQDALRRVASFSDLYLPFVDLTTYVIFTYICPAGQDSNPASPTDTCPGSIGNTALDNISSNQATTATDNRPCCEDITAMDNPTSPTMLESSTSISQFDVFRVQLNMNCLGQEIGMKMSHGSTSFNSLEQVLHHVLDYIVTLNPDRFSRQVCEASPCALEWRLQPNFDTVAEANGWQMSCVSLSEAVHTERSSPAAFKQQANSPVCSSEVADRQRAENADSFTQDDSGSPGAQSPVHADKDVGLVEFPSEERYCRVCFEDLSLGTLHGPAATALTECQHWFCDTCWHTHLSITAREGVARRMECPEYHCGAEVDPGTLLSLLHVRDVMLQQRRGVERKLTRMFRSKWCPNPRCGRVVQLTGKESQNVTEPTSMACPCGRRFCFRCHGVPHWPLGCDDLGRYHALLHKNGDLQTVPPSLMTGLMEVRGKPCPKCHLFIQKDGGCPYMQCVCGHRFFWCCRKSVKGSGYHQCPDIFPVNDLTNTVRMVIKHVDTSLPKERSSLYRLAVHHRAYQHPKEIRMVGKRVEDLRRKLQVLSSKGVDIGEPLAVTATGHCRQSTPSSMAMKLPGLFLTVSQKDLGAKDEEGREGCQATAGYNLWLRTEEPRRALAVTENSTGSSSVHDLTRQHVKRATFAMTKLKIELHNVIEHTAALLHLHQDARSSDELSRVTLNKAEDELERLVFLTSSLDLVLEAQSSRELRQALPWFRRLQRDAKDTMTALARLLFACQPRGQ